MTEVCPDSNPSNIICKYLKRFYQISTTKIQKIILCTMYNTNYY